MMAFLNETFESDDTVQLGASEFQQRRPIRKMTDCTHFVRGYCKLGESCNFRHPDRELIDRGKVCKYWLQQRCFDTNCSFRHPTIRELNLSDCEQFLRIGKCNRFKCCFRHTVANPDIAVCDDWLNHKCQNNRCVYAHPLCRSAMTDVFEKIIIMTKEQGKDPLPEQYLNSVLEAITLNRTLNIKVDVPLAVCLYNTANRFSKRKVPMDGRFVDYFTAKFKTSSPIEAIEHIVCEKSFSSRKSLFIIDVSIDAIDCTCERAYSLEKHGATVYFIAHSKYEERVIRDKRLFPLAINPEPVMPVSSGDYSPFFGVPISAPSNARGFNRRFQPPLAPYPLNIAEDTKPVFDNPFVYDKSIWADHGFIPDLRSPSYFTPLTPGFEMPAQRKDPFAFSAGPSANRITSPRSLIPSGLRDA